MFYYGSRLPHWHPAGGILFVTARLHGSVPAEAIERMYLEAREAERAAQAEGATMAAEQLRLDAQRRYFATLEQHLDNGEAGADWLRRPGVQGAVLAALHHCHDRQLFALLAASVMPNHLHVVLRLPLRAAPSFKEVWTNFKRFTGREANRLLKREGRFWEEESYDHAVRSGDEGIGRVIRYTAHNPVKANLCGMWRAWPGTWISAEWQPTLP